MSDNITLRQFCRDHDLAASTVHRVAGQMGISLSNGVDPVSADRLLTYFGISPAPKTEEKGGAIAVPEMQSIDLQSWGVADASFDIDDPVALAKQAIKAIAVVDQALDDHVTQLEDRRKRTLAAAQQLRTKRKELENKALDAELRSEFASAQISEAERQLRQDVDALGKSSAA